MRKRERRSYNNIGEIREVFKAHGVSIIYAKKLAENQDNEKNQIYLGRGLNAVTNVLPAKYSVRQPSKSEKKRHSDPAKDIIEGALKFFWIGRDGELYHAPNAKLIEYFQYPEVRLSGFLQRAGWGPEAIRRDKQDDFGTRVLLLGVTPGGETLALLLTEIEDPIVNEWDALGLPTFSAAPVLATISTAAKPLRKTASELLRDDLSAIFVEGWHSGRRLRPDGTVVPFTANQAGGYTLEALLDIRSNSSKTPDKYGHEIKAFSRNKISIMTPTPDGGEQGVLPFVQFMRAYGWKRKTGGSGSLVFNGQHSFGKVCTTTGATLMIDGYDAVRHKVIDAAKCKVALRVKGTGVELATWSLEHLASSWSEKHAAAAYVPYVSKTRENSDGTTSKLLKYGPTTWIASGTDVTFLIKAIALGFVMYDPGDEINGAGKPKNRPQWRILKSRMAESMKALYREAELIHL